MLNLTAITTTLIAVAAAAMSLLPAIIAKDEKVSEIRTRWIESLRGDLGILFATTAAVKQRHLDDPEDSEERKSFIGEQNSRFNEAYTRMAIMLSIIADIDKDCPAFLQLLVIDLAKCDVEVLQGTLDSPKTQLSVVLASQWRTIRRGEGLMYVFRLATIVFLSVALVVGAVLAYRYMAAL